MQRPTHDATVPGYRADQRLEAALRFRRMWDRYDQPDDVNYLLKQFGDVSLQTGYLLDYLPIGGRRTGWIWPYARPSGRGQVSGPPPELAKIPLDLLATKRGHEDMRSVEEQTLYKHLSYKRTPMGIFEYAFFVNELWATKSASRAKEWLSLEPLFVRHRFDAVLRGRETQVVRVARPKSLDPVVRLQEGGGEVSFLAYQGGPWTRVFRITLVVEPGGRVSNHPGEVVASLSR